MTGLYGTDQLSFLQSETMKPASANGPVDCRKHGKKDCQDTMERSGQEEYMPTSSKESGDMAVFRGILWMRHAAVPISIHTRDDLVPPNVPAIRIRTEDYNKREGKVKGYG